MKKILITIFILLFSLRLISSPDFIKNKSKITKDFISIYYNQGEDKKTQKILHNFTPIFNSFIKQLGGYDQVPITIILSKDIAEYDEITNHYGGITKVSAGFYAPKNKVIYIKNRKEQFLDDKFFQLLLHESIHAYIDYFYHDVPLWFHEGMAVYFSQQYSIQHLISLGFDSIFNSVPPLSLMEDSYPRKHLSLNAFYGKSALAIKFMNENYRGDLGELFYFKNKNEFLHRIDNFKLKTISFKGKFYLEFEKEFSKYIFLRILYSSSLLLFFLLPLLVIFAWKKQVKQRHNLEEDKNSKVIIC